MTRARSSKKYRYFFCNSKGAQLINLSTSCSSQSISLQRIPVLHLLQWIELNNSILFSLLLMSYSKLHSFSWLSYSWKCLNSSEMSEEVLRLCVTEICLSGKLMWLCSFHSIVPFLSVASVIRISNMKYRTVHVLNKCSCCFTHRIINSVLWPSRKEYIVRTSLLLFTTSGLLVNLVKPNYAWYS